MLMIAMMQGRRDEFMEGREEGKKQQILYLHFEDCTFLTACFRVSLPL
jgi:hypothetical protein